MTAGLLLAACSAKAPDQVSVPTPGPAGSVGASASPGATGSPAPGPVTGGVDRQTICASYRKAEADAEAKLTVVIPKAAEAIGDPAKAGPVLAELKAALAGFEAALKAEAARAGDAELKGAIDADVAALVKAQQDLAAAGNDVTLAFAAINTDQFTAAGEKVKALCAK
ncbi:hypothetical protein [Rhizocola hellebori]|uniref:hypothetical protein n=1 Tax=Rhizocola hellebori TaxID=1392758 RepID=UPI001941A1B7|nr:hypothetical protein [Rhizocola hellebori]